MPFTLNGSLRYYTFSSLDEMDVTHAVFTRRGGVSPKPWDSLNVGGNVGDDSSRVKENLNRSLKVFNSDRESIFDVWQVHGADVVIAEQPRQKSSNYQKADIIITNKKNVSLFMRFADCVPILLYDPKSLVIGLVHAGWKGTIKKAVSVAINTMHREYASSPGDIVACLGPSICKRHYEVGSEVIQAADNVFGNDASKILSKNNGSPANQKANFDLWAANIMLLENAGVNKIEVSNICTACHLDDWYSYRLEQGVTGRFGVLMSL